MESASDRAPGPMSGIPGELAPASVTGRPAGCALGASRWLPAVAVIALTLVAFLPVLGNGFMPNWDDRTNFLDNPHYRGLGPAQLRWMFTTFHAGHYIPLTWLSLGLDYLLWGLHPAGYHLTSLLLHAATALGFYFVSLRLLRLALPTATAPAALRWGAAVAALVFAIHPLRVESVAWATERRDVLSGLFYVLALLCYLKAVERAPAARPDHHVKLVGSPAAAPPPLVRLDAGVLRRRPALQVHRRHPACHPPRPRRLPPPPPRRPRRLARPWLEKLPFFALSAVATVVAFSALLPLGNTRSLADMGLGLWAFLSVYGLAFYLFKTVAPLDLSPLYPLSVTITWWHFAAVAGTAVVAVLMRRRWPAFTAVWLVYAITLGPVLGFFHNGPQAVADRYSYLACLGWALLLGSAATYTWAGARVVRTVLCAAIVPLAVLTWQQASVWRSEVMLWSHAVSLGSGGRAAHANLAAALDAAGRPGEAIPRYLEAMRRSAKKAWWNVRVGRLYARTGDDSAAVRHFSEALAEEPELPEACDAIRASRPSAHPVCLASLTCAA